MTSGLVTAVCVSGPDLLAVPDRRPNRSGIDERPVEGRVAVHPLGLDGDVQLKDPPAPHRSQARGGPLQGGRDADWWAAELDRELPAGRFGENLRTTGLDLTGAVLGEWWRVGTALLESKDPPAPHCSHARSGSLQEGRKRFTARGASGAYLRVLETGDLGAGDAVEVVSRPDHGVTVGLLFRATTTHKSRLPEIAPALDHLPLKDRPRLAARIEQRRTPRS